MFDYGLSPAMPNKAMPSVVYIGNLDVTTLAQKCRQGLEPSQHIHAITELEKHGCRLSFVDAKNFNDSNYIRRLAKVFTASIRCDVVIAHVAQDVKLLSLMHALKIMKTPLVAFLHSCSGSMLNRLALWGIDKLLPLTQTGVKTLILAGVSPRKVTYFPFAQMQLSRNRRIATRRTY